MGYTTGKYVTWLPGYETGAAYYGSYAFSAVGSYGSVVEAA